MLNSKFNALYRWFVPEDLEIDASTNLKSDKNRKAQTLAGYYLIIVPLLIFLFVLSYLLDASGVDSNLWLLVGAAGMGTLNLFVLKFFRSNKIGVLVSILNVLSIIPLRMISAEGIGASISLWYILVPIIAALMISLRWAALIAFVAIGETAFLTYHHNFGIVIRTMSIPPNVQFLVMSLIIVVMVGFMIAYEGIRMKYVKVIVSKTKALEFEKTKIAKLNSVLAEQAQRIADDLKAARAIQQSLLPTFDISNSHFALSSLYRPCEFLSGDFFDIWQKDNKLFFYLADVTSHGVASAQVTYIIKSIFNSILEKDCIDFSTSDILKKFVAQYLQNKINYGVCIQIFIYEPKTQELWVSQSGSQPSLLYRSSEVKIISPAPAPFIHPDVSLDEFDVEIESEKVKLEGGDILLSFTDGAIEREGEKSSLSIMRFAKLFEHAIRHDEWQPETEKQLESYHQQESFADDVSMLRLVIK